MAKLVPCKSCEKEISKSAKTCPNCGHKMRGGILRKLILWPICIFVALVILGAIVGDNGDSSMVRKSTSNHQGSRQSASTRQDNNFRIGDTIETRKFAITIDSVSTRGYVGQGLFASQPSDGAVYVVVDWSYKNISQGPISAFSTPEVKLKDGAGTQYSSDLGASSSYATETNNDNKIVSSLNPGIRVRDSSVFEVSRDLFQPGSWLLHIDADQDALVRLN